MDAERNDGGVNDGSDSRGKPEQDQARVSVDVKLGSYKVPVQSTTINPYSTGMITITPNSAIPVAGYANLTVHSNVPVVTGLATGTDKWIALTSPQIPSDAYLVRNFSTLGFDAATVTNTSSHNVVASLTSYGTSKSGVVTEIRLAAKSTEALASLIPSFMKSPNDTYVVRRPSRVLVLSLTLPSRPRGLYEVATLDGR